MKPTMTVIANAALLVLPAACLLAGETAAPDWVTKLPANKWTLIDEKQSGNRTKGARVVWVEDAQKLVVMGGLFGLTRREPSRPGNMVFDPATGKWAEYKGEPKLPADTSAAMTVKDLLGFAFRFPLPPEVKDLAGERKSRNSPLEGTSRIGGGLAGPTMFFDAVNREGHMVGGNATGFASGSVGNWIYSPDKNEWRKAEFGSKELRELRAAAEAAGRIEKDVVASARNIFYAALPAADETKTVREKLAPAQAAALKAVTEAADRVEKDGAKAGADAASMAVAVKLVREAVAKSQSANDGFAAGKLDAGLIAAAEDAFWRLDEASAALSPEPTPRTGAMITYDPARKLFLLFGGSHHDYMLSDTWTYDPAKRAWRQVWAKIAPRPRQNSQVLWLASARRVAILGGAALRSRFIHCDWVGAELLPPEIWSFDAEKNTWDLLVRPGPETEKKSSDSWPMFQLRNPVALTAGGVLIAPAVGGNYYDDYMISSTWMLRLDPAAADPALSAKAGVPGGTRTYRSIVPEYNPQWYDGAPRGNPAEVDKFVAALPANRWVAVPTAPRPAGERDWGDCHLDPERDQIYWWTGGHCADTADIVQTYHVGINRWSIPYVAGIGFSGIGLTGRPDCNNHTYKAYAFDPVSKKLIHCYRTGTSIYDPDKRDFTALVKDQPFHYNAYGVKCVGTSKGVVAWTGGCNDGGPPEWYFGAFDAKELKWTPLPVKGPRPPANVHGDEGGMTWDTKRNVLYLHAAKAYNTPDPEGKVWKYDLATGASAMLTPRNGAAIGGKFHAVRQTAYLPEQDLVLFGMGPKNVRDRHVAYDPAGDRWVYLNIPMDALNANFDAARGQWNFSPGKSAVGGFAGNPQWDPKRKVIWTMGNYKAVFVLKIDPKTLVVSEDAAK